MINDDNINFIGCVLQLLATELNKKLSRNCLPSDVFGIVGITWTDLFPNEKENFTLGEAEAEHHSAVVSFGRFEVNLDRSAKGVDISAVDADLVWKMIKVCFDFCMKFDDDDDIYL